jgi:FtsH-binding integral membrane protein
MSVVRDFFTTLYKMFAADLVMTALALATVAICATAANAIDATALPFILLFGVMLALVIAVARGAKP